MQPPTLPAGLPEPDPQSLAHSRRAVSSMAARMAEAGGRLSFGEFMQQALYAPGLGYYVAGAAKFGREGDFITAPEVSPLFGQVIARQCRTVLESVANPTILELGAGSGALAAQVLQRLDELGALPDRYRILEISPQLAERQKMRLATLDRRCVERVEWIDRLPDSISGVILANEVADALPVERFRIADTGLLQAHVIAGDNGFEFTWEPASAALRDAVAALDIDFADGYEGDVSLGLKPWVSDVMRSLQRGIALLFDYGVTRRDYYAPGRSGGWLRCHYRHRAHNDPLVLPGIQDLSAWVDFTAVAEAAMQAGATVAGYVTQASFLIEGGLGDEFTAASPPGVAGQAELSRQVQHLTLPSEMGESFKCIGLAQGDVAIPVALTAGDRAATL